MTEKRFKTRNLYEAGYIYAKIGTSFIGLEPDGRDFLFVFENSQCQYLADEYYTGKAMVSAKSYSDAIRTLKDLIFNRLREQRSHHEEARYEK